MTPLPPERLAELRVLVDRPGRSPAVCLGQDTVRALIDAAESAERLREVANRHARELTAALARAVKAERGDMFRAGVEAAAAEVEKSGEAVGALTARVIRALCTQPVDSTVNDELRNLRAVAEAASTWADGEACICGLDFSHSQTNCPAERLDQALFDAVMDYRAALAPREGA